MRVMFHSDYEQVGILLNGTTVEGLIVGGPAYNSKMLCEGDVILKISGAQATEENIHELLKGGDNPGSSVDITVAPCRSKVKLMQIYAVLKTVLLALSPIVLQGVELCLTLTRMALSDIPNRRELFQLFRNLKVMR